MCVCVPPSASKSFFLNKQGTRQDTSSPGNEAGDVSGDMEMGRHFRVPALLTRETEGNGSRHTVCVGSFPSVDPFLL